MLLQCIRIGIRPLLGRELFAGICPEITVMQIQQIAVAQLFTGRSQCHQLGEITGTGTVRLAVLTVRIIPETDAQRVGTVFFQDLQCVPLFAFVIKACTESCLLRQTRYIHTFDKFIHKFNSLSPCHTFILKNPFHGFSQIKPPKQFNPSRHHR